MAAATPHQMCSFLGNTVAAFCERGCCGDECCSTTTVEGSGITYSLIGVVAALIFAFIVTAIIYLILRRKGYCQSDPEDDEPIKLVIPLSRKEKLNIIKEAKERKKKKGAATKVAAASAFSWAGKKKSVQKDSKDTQTTNHKCLPGDVVRFTNGFWLQVKRDKSVPRADDPENMRNVGVNTDAPKMNWTSMFPKVLKVSQAAPGGPEPAPQPAVTNMAAAATQLSKNNALKAANQRVNNDASPRPGRGPSEAVVATEVTPRLVSPAPVDHQHAARHLNANRNESPGGRTVSFGPSPVAAASATPPTTDRQDTIELLNDFTRQMMKNK